MDTQHYIECGCVVDSDGRLLTSCESCRPRSPKEVADALCEQVSRVAGIAVAGARVGATGRWEMEVSPGVWKDYQTILDEHKATT